MGIGCDSPGGSNRVVLAKSAPDVFAQSRRANSRGLTALTLSALSLTYRAWFPAENRHRLRRTPGLRTAHRCGLRESIVRIAGGRMWGLHVADAEYSDPGVADRTEG